jgi:MFS family permease
VALFLLGLLLSLPASILANIYTPKIQNWLAERSIMRSAKRIDALREEIALVSSYREAPMKFHEFLLGTVLRAIYITSVGGIVAAGFFIAGQASTAIVYPRFYIPYTLLRFSVSDLLTMMGQLVGLLTALFLVRICSSSLQVLNRVRNFTRYRGSVEGVLNRLAEKQPAMPSPEQEPKAQAGKELDAKERPLRGV